MRLGHEQLRSANKSVEYTRLPGGRGSFQSLGGETRFNETPDICIILRGGARLHQRYSRSVSLFRAI